MVEPPPDPVWQVEVDHMAPDEWVDMLEVFEDANVYQTWSYGAVRWGQKNLSHLVLKRNGNVKAIAQLRIVRPTKLNFGMAYLRWGPLCHRRGSSFDGEVAVRVATALREEYVKNRKLLLKILPNAFVRSSRAEIYQRAFSDFAQECSTNETVYRTFVLDLKPSLDELRRSLDPKWRNKLNGAEKNGLNVVSGDGPDEYRTFCQLYRQMRTRKAFDTTVEIEEFSQIQADLPKSLRMRVFICERDAVPVAGLVASAIGDSAIYLLGATSDGGLNAKGSYLLQWALIRWLKEKGIRWYDLGGVDPQKNLGVYQFKRGLSGVDVHQLPAFTACTNVVSSAVVKLSLALNDAVRGIRRKRTLR